MRFFYTVVRWFLLTILLYGVYTEAGLWTVVALFLLFLNIEIVNHVRRQYDQPLGDFFTKFIKVPLDKKHRS